MHRAAPAVSLLLLAASVALAQDTDPERVHIRMHKKIAPSVVFVAGGGQQGSGVCIDKEGIILTSATACGTATEQVTVVTPGQKTLTGKVIGRNNDKEIVLVKIDASLPAVELADSDAAKVGQVSYVFGDSYNSIQTDDQVAMSLGVISGVYSVEKKQRGAYYTGPVIETSAAVNPNQDGGALVNSDGRLLGIVTLNYEESKFTGIAIPINHVKADIERMIKAFKNPTAAVKVEPRPGWLGATVRELDDVDGVKVERLAKDGPAEKAGLKAGDVITRVDGRKILTVKGLNDAVSKFEVGAKVKLTVERDGKEQALTVTLGKRNEY
jgi:S1-C subfamily serine protease